MHVLASVLSAEGWQAPRLPGSGRELSLVAGPRQRVVAYLGEMDAAGHLGIHQQAAGAAAVAQRRLFREIEPQWVEVDLKRIAIERKRALAVLGSGWSCVRQVGLVDFLERTLPAGREEIPWPVMAQILILARSVTPPANCRSRTIL